MNERSLKILEEGVGDLLTPIDLDAFRAHNRAKEKGLVDKRMSEKEAIRRFVDEGDYVGVELYGTVRCPMSLTRELIRGGYRSLRGVGQ